MLFVWLGVLLGCMLMGASATNRFGRNGERYRPTKPKHSGKRGDERPRFGEAVQRVVLDIRTNDAADRSRKRSRRRKHRSPSSSRSSSSSRDRAKKDREEIARLKSLLAEKEAREQKREADCQRADAEAARKRELEEFKASVMALLPKPASPQIPGANAAAQSLFTVEGARRASYFLHEITDFSGSNSWEDVESRLKAVSCPKLKEMLERKGIDEIPSSKPAVINAVMRILKAEFPSGQ